MSYGPCWTHEYRGHFIHGSTVNGVEWISWQNSTTYDVTYVKSYRAAQLAITKHIKEQSK